MVGFTYADAGVDIDRGDELVSRIAKMASRTKHAHVLEGIGGFAGLCKVPPGMHEPVLVSGTDGVGTKLRVAFLTGVHHTVGIDLVAMCVNDVITTGATPLFFLDYFATGALDNDVAAAVISGIADGCEKAGCALIGGETAEMPDSYPPGEYDIAGFAVGVVERSAILDGSAVRDGDAVIGVASSGLHSNGYSLARKVLLEHAKLTLDEEIEGITLKHWLLEPTRIYVNAVKAALATDAIHAISHITGGGLVGNVPRVLPHGLGVELKPSKWPVPAIFHAIKKHGNVTPDEMFRVFNMGLGLIVIVDAQTAPDVLKAMHTSGERAWLVGEVKAASSSAQRVWFV